MEITVNNQKQILNEGESLIEVLAMSAVTPQGLAIAVNNTIVPKAEWPTYILKPNDKVVLIKAAQGG